MIDFENFIIAVGGEDSNTVEKYDIYTNKWEKMKWKCIVWENILFYVFIIVIYMFFLGDRLMEYIIIV